MMHVWGPKIMKTTNMYVQTEWNVLNRSVKSVRARASVRCYDDEPERRRVNVVATSNQRHAGFDKVSVGGKNMENRASRMYRHAISWKWHEEGKKNHSLQVGRQQGRPQTKTIQGLGTPACTSGDRCALPHKKCTCKILQQTLCIGSNKNIY